MKMLESMNEWSEKWTMQKCEEECVCLIDIFFPFFLSSHHSHHIHIRCTQNKQIALQIITENEMK